MMELERFAICSSPSSSRKNNTSSVISSSAKRTNIAAPRPLAPVPLKHSGTSLPVFRLNDSTEYDMDELEPGFELDQDAETEFQQILGCGFQSSFHQDAYFDGLNTMSIDSGDYPFRLTANMDFPRLGASPAPANEASGASTPTKGSLFSGFVMEDEGFYCLPSRAHNPMIQNSTFGELEQQWEQLSGPLTSHLKLALGFAPFESPVRTRNRSYSEPILPEQLRELNLV